MKLMLPRQNCVPQSSISKGKSSENVISIYYVNLGIATQLNFENLLKADSNCSSYGYG